MKGYLGRINIRRETYSGVEGAWADYNLEMEIIDYDSANGKRDSDIVRSAIHDCNEIIVYLQKNLDKNPKDFADALKIKLNQFFGLEKMLEG